MAILITGGGGFLGSHLVSFLEKDGHDIVLFKGDVSNEDDVVNFRPEKQIDSIIHLAAVVSNKDKKVFKKVNVEGTENIVKFARRINAERFLFLSSIKVLSSSGDPYIDSKREAEKIVINSGLPYIIIRPSMIYGTGDEKNIGFLLKIAKFSPIIPVLNFRIQPIFIGDIVKIIVSSLKIPANKIFNITGVEIISFRNLLNELKFFNYNFFSICLPRFFSCLIKLFSFLPFSPMPHWQVKGLLSSEIFEGPDWQELFNIKATPFRQGLRRTINKK